MMNSDVGTTKSSIQACIRLTNEEKNYTPKEGVRKAKDVGPKQQQEEPQVRVETVACK